MASANRNRTVGQQLKVDLFSAIRESGDYHDPWGIIQDEMIMKHAIRHRVNPGIIDALKAETLARLTNGLA